MKNKKTKVFGSMFFLVIIIGIFLYWQNNHILVTKYDYLTTLDIDKFDDFKILQISDLHNKDFNEQLIQKVKKESPDIIVITGDIIDSRNTNISIALETVSELIIVAPVFYVTGNHESRISDYKILEDGLDELGVTLLLDKYVTISLGEESIRLIGLQDPSFYSRTSDDYIMQEHMSDVVKSSKGEGINILLSHRPELMELYNNMGVSFVFSGHAHGGQIRLPFIGGIIAPDQGLFPRYDSGMYEGSNTTMIVSRGLGNSLFPFRIFNRPELVVVTIRYDR